MTSIIHDVFDPTFTDTTVIITVEEVKNGQATMVNLSGTLFPVSGHLSSVEALHPGDRVLALRTGDGIIVAGRLRSPDEAPSPRLEIRDGQLVLEATQSVHLKAGDNRIEVHADGRIEINGRRITGRAKGPVQLIGATIRLN